MTHLGRNVWDLKLIFGIYRDQNVIKNKKRQIKKAKLKKSHLLIQKLIEDFLSYFNYFFFSGTI